MNVRVFVVAALVALTPAAASADAEEAPRWTVGAGIANFGEIFLASPTGGTGSAAALLGRLGDPVPVATFFVERRVGDRTWLVFGAAGMLTRQDFDPPASPGTFGVITKDDSERGSLSAGVRRVVSRPGTFVDVSVQGTVEGGYLHDQQELTSSGGITTVRSTGGFASVTGGIALDRTLTGGLGLRISTPLLGASWSQVERKDDAGTRDATSASVFVVLAPRIELRLAF